MKKLALSFYTKKDVVQIAKELIGMLVVTRIDDALTIARIVETEAYKGITDRASHSYNGKRTARNEHMYMCAGTVYIYICYGMHQMLNVVTNEKEIPDAILIRAVEPVAGIETMLERTGKEMGDVTLTRGPGNLAKAMGIQKKYSGIHFTGNEIMLYQDEESKIPIQKIGISKRIGVASAGADALLPYRFYLKGNKYVSASPNK
ncbi:MAG: DNA-3-methyladenine glycosylase [Niastella sp.]|nr:DNA-3-methyladenine glycosylase [Niastella sp.]